MRVLHVVNSYYPAIYFGGPIFSVKALVDCLALYDDISIHVSTTDSAGQTRKERLEAKSLLSPKNYSIIYHKKSLGRGFSWRQLLNLPRDVAKSDIVHITSTYNVSTLCAAAFSKILRKPVVWSPRGTVQATVQWKEANLRWLKRVYQKIFLACLPHRTIIHTTSDEETLATRSVFSKFSYTQFSNGVDIPNLQVNARRDPYSLLFLSRLTEKKGVFKLLEIMQKLPESYHLNLYGAGSAEFESNLKRMIAEDGLEDRIKICGVVGGEEKNLVYQKASLFVLPSFTENFGNVIAEALANSLPVITTKGTPWEGLEEHDCGRWLENDPALFAKAIVSYSAEDLKASGERGRSWMIEKFTWEKRGAELYNAYQKVSSRSFKGSTL